MAVHEDKDYILSVTLNRIKIRSKFTLKIHVFHIERDSLKRLKINRRCKTKEESIEFVIRCI